MIARVLSEHPASDPIVVVDEEGPGSFDPELIGRMIDDLERADGVVVCAPVTEAVKEVEGDRVVGGVDRSTLSVIRRPEVLRRRAIISAVQKGTDPDVDLAASVARNGGRLRCVQLADDG
jgi:2-C-methyl-D-erythritol 4-phosphate cytidylyltransferase